MKVAVIAGRVMADVMNLLKRDFPRTVRIETTSRCNAACTFCPRDSMGRAKETMRQDLFERIIQQCVVGGTKLVHLHNFGEPLLDKDLPDRIRFAKRSGISRVKIFSNGQLLQGELAKKLLDSGLDEIKISLDGADPEEFNTLRIGLSHQRVMDNAREFRAMRDRAGKGPTIVAACTQTSNRKQSERMLKGVVDRVDHARVHNWGGAMGIFPQKKIRKPCDRLWRTFTVLYNGDVALCCLDYSGKEILGNLRDQTIREIWDNDRYRLLRRLHRESRQAAIPLCKDCSKCFF